MPEISIKHICLALVFVAIASSLVFADANGTNATNGTNGTLAAATPKPAVTPSPTPSPEKKLLDKIKYFAWSGETSNYTKVTIDGIQYYVVTINGNPAILLDSKLEAETRSSIIAKAAEEYVKVADKPFKKSDVDTLRAKLNDLNESFQKCRYDQSPGAYYNFSHDLVGGCYNLDAKVTANLKQCWIIYEFDLTLYTDFAKSVQPYKNSMKNGSNTMRDTMSNVSAGIDAIAAAAETGDSTILAAKLSEAAQVMAAVKAGADNFTGAHNVMRAIVPWGTYGKLNTCTINNDAITALQTAFESSKNFPNATTIAAGIKLQTEARLMTAVRKEANDTTANYIAKYDVAYKKLDAQFKETTGGATIFAAKNYEELKSKSAAIQAANTSEDAKKALSDFNAKYEAANKLLLDTTVLLLDLKDAITAADNASSTLATATKEFGTNDERINALQAETTAISKALELKTGDLAAGRPVAKADLTGITLNATTIAVQTATLPRRENQVDIIIIGGVVGILILGALAFVFLRKFKITLQSTKNMKEVPIEKMNK